MNDSVRPALDTQPDTHVAPALGPEHVLDAHRADLAPKAKHESIQILAPGESLPACHPGDFLLIQGTGLISRLIRFGERLRHPRPAAQWSHAALIVGNGQLIEALARGIQRTDAAKYDRKWRALVRVSGTDGERQHAVQYAESCLREHYGFVDFASVALSQLAGFGLILTTAHSQICSELVAHSLERLGYIFAKTPELTSPADLYCLFALLQEDGK